MSVLLLKLIPSTIRITRKVNYEILWVDNFPNPKQVGECRFDPKQIVLKKNEPPVETLKSFIHELFHAFSFEYPGMNLTEKQVIMLEEAVYRFLKLNKFLSFLLKNNKE